MKKSIAALFVFLSISSIFAKDKKNETEEKKEKQKSEWSRAGTSDVPSSKHPRKADSEKVKEADNTDPDGRKNNADVLKFGLEDEILDLLKKMKDEKDERFFEETYNLYEETKSALVKENVMEFFREMKDPCLEDYAVMILNDPFDESISTVNTALMYIGEMKTTAAVPAVEQILEGDNEKFYIGAIEALGKIGGKEEAMYLTDYFDNEELTTAQKQSVVKTLGLLHSSETFDKLLEMAENEDENTFVRMYASEALGQIGSNNQEYAQQALDSLIELFKDRDPNLRSYVVKGVANFTTDSAEELLIQATRDSHVKVRLEAIAEIRKRNLSKAVPYLVYRAKNDPEPSVKNACYPAIAEMNTSEGNAFLVEQIESKKTGDGTKAKIATALLEFNHAGDKEICKLAIEIAADDRRKSLRYSLGKDMAKWGRPAYEEVCREFLKSKDVLTQGTALDIYARGRYSSLTSEVQALSDKANPSNRKDANAIKAAKILGIDWEKREPTDSKKDEKKSK